MPLYLRISLSLLACLLLLLLPLLLALLSARARRDRRRLRRLAALHDTLLQSMQGLILRCHSVGHRLPAGSDERAAIDAMLDQADEVLAEASHQVARLCDGDATPPNRA